jgi:hypothetical protein
MICSFFILPSASRRDDPDDIRSPRKNDGDQLVFQKTYRDPALLVVAIRFAKKNRSVEDPGCIFEVDAVLVEIRFALVLVPLERGRRARLASGIPQSSQMYIQMYFVSRLLSLWIWTEHIMNDRFANCSFGRICLFGL